MLSALANAFKTPDLRKKILFTLMILAIFRLGSVIPVPGVNVQALHTCITYEQQSAQSGLYSLMNLFSGGALLQLSLFSLGIMPYITSSIILQLLTVVVPRLEALKKEGQSGTAKITQYTRYLTLVLAVLNSTVFVTLAVNGQLFQGCTDASGNPAQVVYSTDVFPQVLMILTMTAGTGVVMWLGELVTERGVGNGMSVMIFTSVAAIFPTSLWGIKTQHPGQQGWIYLGTVVIIGLLVMLAVLFIEQAQRRIPVQYAKRMVGTRVFGGSTTYLPIKVNQSGVVPVIFASSLMYIPVIYAQFRPNTAASQWITANFVTGGHPVYMAVLFILIVFFCYFYVAITFNPDEVADNMKKYGGFIPGVRAGSATRDYLNYVLTRLTLPGSLYLGVIALIPSIAFVLLQANQKFPFGGTSILIVVSVGLDTVKQIESQLQQRKYEGFLR